MGRSYADRDSFEAVGGGPAPDLRDRQSQPACSRYQSTLLVSTMIAARITNSRTAPRPSALSSDTSSPLRAAYSGASSSEEHTSDLQSLMRIASAVTRLK